MSIPCRPRSRLLALLSDGWQVEALDGKFKDVITVATIKDIQGRKVACHSRPRAAASACRPARGRARSGRPPTRGRLGGVSRPAVRC